MKSKPSKNYYQRMFIVRNESAQSRKYQLYQSAPQTSISFMINGQSLTKTKVNTQPSLTPKEIKVKQALKSIKYKLQSLKFEQSEIKKQVMQQSEAFKSNLQQIKSKEVQNINAIQQYFNEQNKYPLIYLYFPGSTNKRFRNFNNKQKLQTIRYNFCNEIILLYVMSFQLHHSFHFYQQNCNFSRVLNEILTINHFSAAYVSYYVEKLKQTQM